MDGQGLTYWKTSVEHNQGNFPYYPSSEELKRETDSITSEKSINPDNLEVLAEKVLRELRYGQQSSHHKIAKKSLKRLIELAATM